MISVGYGVAFLGRYFGGYYFHDSSDFEAANTWFFLDYLRLGAIALSGILLQYYLESKQKLALWLLLVSIVELIAVFGLSGNRGLIVFPVFFLAAYGFGILQANNFNQWNRRSLFAAAGALMLFVVFVNSVWLRFRSDVVGEHDTASRANVLLNEIKEGGHLDLMRKGNTGLLDQAAYRFQEFGYAGMIMEYFEWSKKVGFEGFDRIFYFLLPSFMRSRPYWESTDTDIAMLVNSEIESGAPPITTIGDLYRRWDWTGIVVGMAFIGVALKMWDQFFSKPTLQRRLHFISFWFSMLTIHLTMGIQFWIIISLRPFFVTWLMAYILSRIVMKFSRDNAEPNVLVGT
jgi:hypothetical protein